MYYKILKYFFLAITSLVALFLAVVFFIFIFLQTDRSARFLADKTTNFLYSQYELEVEVEKIYYRFPLGLTIQNFKITDEQNQTIAEFHELSGNLSVRSLLQQNINLYKLDIKDLNAIVENRLIGEETSFNFDFIIDKFVSDEAVEKEEESGEASWGFTMGRISLENLDLTYQDQLRKDTFNVLLKNLSLRANEIDFVENIYNINHLLVDGLTAKVIMNDSGIEEVEDDEETELFLPFVSLGNLQLNNITTNISLNNDKDIYQLNWTVFEIYDLLLDKDLNGKSLSWEGFNAYIHQNIKGSDEIIVKDVDIDEDELISQTETILSLPFKIDWGSLNWKIDNISFKQTIDNVEDFTFEGSAIELGIDKIVLDESFYGEVDIQKLTFEKFMEYELEYFSLNISSNESSTQLKNLKLRTLDSSLDAEFLLPTVNALINLDDIPDFDGKLTADLNLKKIRSFFDEIPDMGQAVILDENLKLNITAKSSDNILKVHDFSLLAGNHTRLKFNALVNEWKTFDEEKVSGTLVIEEFITRKSDLRGMYALADVEEGGIDIPSMIALKGDINGSMQRGNSGLQLRADGAVAQNNIRWREAGGKIVLNNKLRGRDIKLGEILKIDEIGNLSFQSDQYVQLNRDYSLDSLDAFLNIEYFSYNEAVFQTPELSLSYKDEKGKMLLVITDSLLDARLSGDFTISDTLQTALVNFDLNYFDSRFLLQEDSVIFENASLALNINGFDWQNASMDLMLTGPDIYRQQDFYAFERFELSYLYKDKNFNLNTRGDFFTLMADGVFDADSIYPAFYYHLATKIPYLDDENILEVKSQQYVNAEIEVNAHPILSEWLAEFLVQEDDIYINAEFSNIDSRANVELIMPKAVVSGIDLDSTFLQLRFSEDSLLADINFYEINTAGITFYKPNIHSRFEENRLTTNLLLRDSLYADFFKIGFHMFEQEDGYSVSVDTSGIFIAGNYWNIPAENVIFMRKDAFEAQNFVFSYLNQRVEVQTGESSKGLPLRLLINNFEIDFLNQFIADENIAIGGLLQLDGKLNDYEPEVDWNANMQIDNLILSGLEAGKLSLSAEKRIESPYFFDITLDGPAGNLRVDGEFEEQESAFDLDLNLQNLNLSLAEDFVTEDLEYLRGFADGNMRLTGTIENPEWSGRITFRNMETKIAYLQTDFFIDNQHIDFENTDISFNQFRIRDAQNRTLTLSGKIAAENLENPTFDLRIQTNRFRVLNTTRDDNELFYGSIFIGGNIDFTGSLISPRVQSTLVLEDGTDLTIILPDSEVDVIEEEGIVEFVRLDEFGRVSDTKTDTIAEFPDKVELPFQNVVFNANVRISQDVRMKVVIDERANDFLEIQGGGNLAVGMDESGILSMSGRYELSGGSYQMSFYNAVRRRFEISEGSSINWFGDPLNAEMDIKAVYEIRTDAADLVMSRMPSGSSENRNVRQLLPFEVLMSLKGELLQPEITFDIEMPPQERGALNGLVYSQIQNLRNDESEMNKQVFSLLILNRFLPESGDGLGGGGGIESTARTSASRILTQQLNRLSAQYIPGVDISFDLDSYEDFANGEQVGRTDLQIQVSRSFLDERLRVEVGGNVELEGETREQGWGDLAGDITLEYKITDDGRLKLKGFRRKDYESFPESQLIETGVGIIFKRDYNSFGELFRNTKRKEEETNVSEE
ncbi:MAG: translocation/assembly module TamB [Chitinophagaceae bacterium]|nr:MAG: translocation/assembly module TamB [Chitinophagaceae bacterium]